MVQLSVILNQIHCQSGQRVPIVYGWIEIHGQSGTAVTISSKGGCLACGFNNVGEPLENMTIWPENQQTISEPSCADRFQPYGAIELMYVTTLISEVALDEILHPSLISYRKVWLSSRKRVEDAGGNFTSFADDAVGMGAKGECVLDLDWPAKCVSCK